LTRQLWQTMVELLESVSPDSQTGVRVTDVSLDLPIEVQIRQTHDGLIFLADLPRWRWRTVFDPKGGRLKLRCSEGEVTFGEVTVGEVTFNE
jgi:hypothetical protein